jgi:hypothetical protein
MQRTIDIRDLPERLRAVLDDVTHARASYILAEDGRPEAAIIPYEQFHEFHAMRTKALLDHTHRLESQLAALASGSSEFDAAVETAIAAGLPDVLARLTARRVLNDRLPWGPGDSTEIIREMREDRLV